MPSEFHPQHCTCRDCRFPGDKNVLEPALMTLGAIVGLMIFSFAAILFVRLLSGAGQ